MNLDHATNFDGRDFRLADGTRLPVSRDLVGAARSAFGGRLRWHMRWPVSAVLLPLLAVLAVAFCRVVTLPVWKSVSIFLAVCGVWSSLSCLTVVANAALSPGSKNTP